MVDLAISFAGLELKSPVWVASQTPISATNTGTQAKLLEKYVRKGAGMVKTHFICQKSGTPPFTKRVKRVYAAKSKPPFGYEGLFIISPTLLNIGYLQEGLDLVRKLKRRTEVPVCANIVSTEASEESWSFLAQKFKEANADLIETNFSCPNFMLSELALRDQNLPDGVGWTVSHFPDLAANIVRRIKKDVNLPLCVKISCEIGFPQFLILANKLKEAGADVLTLTNAPISISPPDICNHGKPSYPFMKFTSFSATHGPWNRFLTYKYVAAVSHWVKGIELTAVGGLVDPEHVLEVMMLGAKTAELSSGIIWRTHNLLKETIKFLKRFLKENKYSSVEEIVGLGLPYIRHLEQVEFIPSVARINYDLCQACGRCCENICTASKRQGNYIIVDEDECCGCGLCVPLCPHGARFLELRNHKRS